MAQCSGWCTPLIIYLILSVLGLAGILRQEKEPFNKRIACSLVWTLFWGLLMFELCNRCYEGWAWFVLVGPLVLVLLILVIFLGGVVDGFGKCEVADKCVITDDKGCKQLKGKFTQHMNC